MATEENETNMHRKTTTNASCGERICYARITKWSNLRKIIPAENVSTQKNLVCIIDHRQQHYQIYLYINLEVQKNTTNTEDPNIGLNLEETKSEEEILVRLRKRSRAIDLPGWKMKMIGERRPDQRLKFERAMRGNPLFSPRSSNGGRLQIRLQKTTSPTVAVGFWIGSDHTLTRFLPPFSFSHLPVPSIFIVLV